MGQNEHHVRGEVASRTDIAAPESASPDGGEHRTNHADECDESYHRIKPSNDDVCDDDPIEIQSWSRKVAMEILLFLIILIHNPYLFLNSVQSYEENNRQMNYFVYLCIDSIYYQRSV